mmetsp:Transcript_53479/g.125069  ORF Transcript_53479/g.125069 Transcript_53479/m.125069 type:complete len:325 (-) Transcript_53479:3352-4326(-)
MLPPTLPISFHTTSPSPSSTVCAIAPAGRIPARLKSPPTKRRLPTKARARTTALNSCIGRHSCSTMSQRARFPTCTLPAIEMSPATKRSCSEPAIASTSRARSPSPSARHRRPSNIAMLLALVFPTLRNRPATTSRLPCTCVHVTAPCTSAPPAMLHSTPFHSPSPPLLSVSCPSVWSPYSSENAPPTTSFPSQRFRLLTVPSTPPASAATFCPSHDTRYERCRAAPPRKEPPSTTRSWKGMMARTLRVSPTPGTTDSDAGCPGRLGAAHVPSADELVVALLAVVEALELELDAHDATGCTVMSGPNATSPASSVFVTPVAPPA